VAAQGGCRRRPRRRRGRAGPSPAHARVLADGTHDLPDHVTAEAEPVLLEAAGRLDPPRLRRAVAHLRLVAYPDGADQATEHRHQRRGLWLAPTWEGMVAVDGLLEPEAGQTLLAALEPLARPADAEDTRSGWAAYRRRPGRTGPPGPGGRAAAADRWSPAPAAGHRRPRYAPGSPGAVGGEAGWAGPLDPEACRRLACDGALTRVVVTRHHNHHQPGGQHPDGRSVDHDHGPNHGPAPSRGAGPKPSEPSEAQGRLRAAMAVLPPVLGGAPSQPLDVGRASRVIQPTQRSALAVRDGGRVFPGCDRPLAWCEAHHLLHWLDGGSTDLANLAMLCRAHHRAVSREVRGHRAGFPHGARTPSRATVPGNCLGPNTSRPPRATAGILDPGSLAAASLGRPCRMRAGGSAG
jgi:hypothetical protein